MIYWWLFNVWAGVMTLAEFSKKDGILGNPHWFWWAWISFGTVVSFALLISEWRKLKSER